MKRFLVYAAIVLFVAAALVALGVVTGAAFALACIGLACWAASSVVR